MSADKYQISIKATYLKLILLKDELASFHEALTQEVSDAKSWLNKLRATRSVFVTLNNVSDVLNTANIDRTDDYVTLSRQLKKKLSFANHFRNRGIAHLDQTLTERAVQWTPQIFNSNIKEHEDIKVIEGHKSIIETCINSFVDENGLQKIFKTEIDLMYPPNTKQFYEYLFELVTESIVWLNESSALLSAQINYHEEDDAQELATIAAQTNFNLKTESAFEYPLSGQEERIANTLQGLKDIGADNEVIEFVKNKFKI